LSIQKVTLGTASLDLGTPSGLQWHGVLKCGEANVVEAGGLEGLRAAFWAGAIVSCEFRR